MTRTSAARCVLLDLGKVLLDFDFTRFSQRMQELTALDLQSLNAVFTGGGLARRYECGFITDVGFYQELCSRIGGKISWETFVAAWNSIFSPEPIMPETLIQSLARNADLWIVSNTNKLHFDHISMHYSFLSHFKGYILSHEVGVMKPDARIFTTALSRAGAQAEHTLFVDDQPANVEAARALGIDAFQFVNLDQFAAELQKRSLL